MKDKIGIYKITSPSGKVYIGQSWRILSRFNQYRRPNACKNQRYLNHSFSKYGTDNHIFEIIHELPEDISQEIMDKYEKLYLDSYIKCGFEMLNIREAGSNGRLSEETKKRIGASNKIKLKGNKPPTTGKSFEEYYGEEKATIIKNKISAKLKGTIVSEQSLQKRSAFYKLNPHPNKGKKTSEETKLKQSIAKKRKPGANKGYKHSAESKNKMSLTKKKLFNERKMQQSLFQC